MFDMLCFGVFKTNKNVDATDNFLLLFLLLFSHCNTDQNTDTQNSIKNSSNNHRFNLKCVIAAIFSHSIIPHYLVFALLSTHR